MMDRDPKYRQFWKSLAKDARIQQEFIPLRDTDEDFMRFGWGQGSAPLGITFHQPGHVISNLCLNYRGKRERTKNLFDDLERDKSRIEKDFKAQFDEDFKREFGGSPELKWERRDDKQESWITVCREGVSIEDEPVKMEATRKWAINTVIALKKVLGPRLTSLLAKTS